ncbi:MAG: formylglycine-generating enzyme family protein [Rhodospirillum sp.]|nr:formylglycine-generating enzyme family protein [Rhodospirillum sp.]MCF8490242.1 formylglycine-generating enzyme family protein [Rhodospirillum sp.]
MRAFGAVLFGLATFGPTPGAVARTSPPAIWPPSAWDPQPDGTDLVLPMPCGGSMAFKAIPTETSPNWMWDTDAVLGTTNPALGYRENRVVSGIAGGFAKEENPAKRFYYIGKYEVTQHQYDAVMADHCPQPIDDLDRLPAEALNWYDAVDFTRRYTSWLVHTAPDSLPKEDGKPGFLRLPTEVEWEFAARAVPFVLPSKARDRLFPMDGSTLDYAWVSGTQSCYGYAQAVGELKPNPAGLYDILGNVAEITQDLFHARTPSSIHGQVGGFTVKGGSCETSKEELRTSQRAEVPFFNADGSENHPPFTGARLVIAAPVFTSLSRMEAMERDFGSNASGTQPPQDDPVGWLKALAATQRDEGLKRDLDSIAAAMTAERTDQARKEARTARRALLNGTMLMRVYRADDMEATRLGLFAGREGATDAIKRAADQWKGRRSLSADAYLSMVVDSVESYPDALLQEVHSQVRTTLTATNNQALPAMLDRFLAHVARYRAEGDPSMEAIRQDALAPF